MKGPRYEGFTPSYYRAHTLEEVLNHLFNTNRPQSALSVTDRAAGSSMLLERRTNPTRIVIAHRTHGGEPNPERWGRPAAALCRLDRLISEKKTGAAHDFMREEGRELIVSYRQMLRDRNAIAKSVIRQMARRMRKNVRGPIVIEGPMDPREMNLDRIISADDPDDLAAAVIERNAHMTNPFQRRRAA